MKQMGLCGAAVDGGGQDRNRTLLQLAANPLSSLCCALVAVRSTAPASTGPDSEQNHSSSAVVSRASSDSGLDPRPQGTALLQLCDTWCTMT